jgi:hypothetical protein
VDRCPFAESVLRFMHLGPGALRDLLPAITSDVPAQQGNLKPPWALMLRCTEYAGSGIPISPGAGYCLGARSSSL